jgi:predicted nucleic acid-binding Zn ribbon protein
MESMREMLRGSLGRSLRTMQELDRLTAAWPVACGAALARRGVITSLEDGILRVEVPDPAWIDQLRAMQAVLQHDLARIARVELGGIHFVKAGARPSGK